MSLLSYNTLTQCPLTPSLGRASPLAAGAMFLLASGPLRSLALTNKNTTLALNPQSSWQFTLTPFESILLGYSVIKYMILRYADLDPILDGLFGANRTMMAMGGRRKRSTDPKVIKDRERLAETMFTILRRLDMQDCLLRTLCDLQVHSLQGHPLTRETKLTLSALSKSGWNRRQKRNPNPDFLEERPVLSVFEEAVDVGWNAKGPSGIECQERYFTCPLTQDDILKHFDAIKVFNVLN